MDVKKRLFAAALVVALAAAGILMNGARDTAKATPGAAPVNIISPLPLPTTATQSGTWNVGITGQPLSVNVNNSPAVSLAAGATVLAKNLDEPGRAPYQETLQMAGVTQGCFVVCSTVFNFAQVPAGKRLVIKELNIDAFVLSGGTVSSSQLSSTLLQGPTLFLPLTRLGGGVLDEWITNQQVNLYVDPGNQPFASVSADVAHASDTLQTVTLTGYYVSLP